MTSQSTARRWLSTLARHYPSLLVSGVCHNALAEIDELEQHAEVLRRDCHEFLAERDAYRDAPAIKVDMDQSCSGCVRAPTEAEPTYDEECNGCRRFYGDLYEEQHK
ncbi:hypothetical protein CU669_14985 [Paramagnetospirillum kuznetsovii]|uniref:Uncharacterized protein n=1 Tax=Paramagnetospirillum kuznetsovii TaxID=2053833 RepID=A0A364NVE5_9PROT|nr:hypothetical protein [Paramagnetospirillum kuznetsovii]RAU21059.1 hypothetical protein CU669_14985 [Paramagnetospirillum kuznetsovii]